mmetsp:Transcript_7770/g.22250  ORF Transcript_7770/g.22250 Transcript_7770/m.22250 type:complete len:347 (+) Transcript_7770:218-1258(+)
MVAGEVVAAGRWRCAAGAGGRGLRSGACAPPSPCRPLFFGVRATVRPAAACGRGTGFLPAGVAAEDHVAAEDGVVRHLLVDGVGHDAGSHRELDGGGVDDADDVARAGRLEDAEEGPVEAVLRVQLDHLLVVVRALQQLDPRVERPPVRLEQDLDAVDGGVEGVGAEGAALDGHARVEALGRRRVDVLGDDVGGEGKLDLADVADGNRVWAAGRLDDGAEGAELAVLDVHAHLARRVVRPLPQLDVRVQRAALSAEHHLHLLDRRRAVRPGAERAALDEDGGVDAGAGHGAAGGDARRDARGGRDGSVRLHGDGGARRRGRSQGRVERQRQREGGEGESHCGIRSA